MTVIRLPHPTNIPGWLARSGPFLLPVTAVVFIVLWIFAETGRIGTTGDGDFFPIVRFFLPLLLLGLSIALSHVQPLAAMPLALVTLIVQSLPGFTTFGSTMWPAYLGLIIVSVQAGHSARPTIRGISLAFSLATGLAVATILARIPDEPAPSPTATYLLYGTVLLVALVPCLAAILLRLWRQRNDTHAQLAEITRSLATVESELAVTTERSRIAHDVHDIMAHSLAVIIAQADGARYARHSQPEVMRESLENIATSARSSFTEVRALIDWLTNEVSDTGQPQLTDLPELYERMRTAGLTILTEELGETTPLPASRELATYRIVQESLTNALRHGNTSEPVRVVIDWHGAGLSVSITSHAADDAAAVPAGRGIRGMMERARLTGGWLAAGLDPTPPRTFLVTAFIPTAEESTETKKPRDHSRRDDQHRNRNSMNPISPIRVLVVDDQQLFCAGISLLINSQNDLTVVGMAHDGLAAVELAATSTPDVILMDVRMPLLNGIEATARILRAAGGETPPPRVVVLTTFQRDGAVAHAIRAGASGFLLKDAHPDFVLASIRAVHEGQSVIAASATADILRHNSRAADAASPSSRGAEEAIEILSPREKEIYLLVAKGLSNGDIARAAFIGETTVKSHVGSILTKLGVMSRAQIIAHAYDNRLIG